MKDKTALFLFLLAIISAGYFVSPNNSNQNARLDPIFSYVEEFPQAYPFNINKYLPNPLKGINTVDWSFYNKNLYSNKAPGSLLLGIPVYAILYNIEKAFGLNTNDTYVENFNIYIINFFLSILPFAFSALALFYLLIKTGRDYKTAKITSLIYILCTPLWAYSTHLWGNAISTFFLVIGVNLLLNKSKKSILYSSFFLFLASSIEYLCAIPVLFIFIIFYKKVFKNLIYFLAGGLIPIIFTALYHYICFGSIFHTSTSFTNPGFMDSGKFLGIFGIPDLKALFSLYGGSQRGLFLCTPILAFGLASLLIQSHKKASYFLLTLLVVSYSLIISSFNGWQGGATITARYLFPFNTNFCLFYR